MKRRTFVQSLGAAAVATGLGNLSFASTAAPVNKRDALLEVVHGTGKQDYYPGAFFTHFPVENHFGPTAVSSHLDYFRATGMDMLKIQYELRFPFIESLTKPSDWANVPLLGKDFYEPQLDVIKGIVKEGKKEALVIPTVYSPLSFAGHFTAYKHHVDHLNEDPDAVKKGLDKITESTLIFVRECAKLGVDGYFQATQGGEANRFVSDQIFSDYIKPCDLAIADEIAAHSECHILHIHNGGDGYKDYSAFTDYPSDVINCGLHLHDSTVTPKELYSQFKKPFMGGFKRDEIIYGGSEEQIRSEAKRFLSDAPERFILGATCTIPSDVDRSKIRAAIDTAHSFV